MPTSKFQPVFVVRKVAIPIIAGLRLATCGRFHFANEIERRDDAHLPSLHPQNTGFTAEYRTILYVGYAGFIGLFVWLQNLGARYEQARLALEGDGSL